MLQDIRIFGSISYMLGCHWFRRFESLFEPVRPLNRIRSSRLSMVNLVTITYRGVVPESYIQGLDLAAPINPSFRIINGACYCYWSRGSFMVSYNGLQRWPTRQRFTSWSTNDSSAGKPSYIPHQPALCKVSHFFKQPLRIKSLT